MRLIVYSYFCAHISQCKPRLNLNFLLLLLQLKSCLKTRKIFMRLAISMQRTHTHTQISVSRSEERVVLCLATPVWQSLDARPRAWRRSNNFRHTCTNVSVTLSSSICDPMKWLRYDKWKKAIAQTMLFGFFWYGSGGFDCSCNICLDQYKRKVEEGRKWAKFGIADIRLLPHSRKKFQKKNLHCPNGEGVWQS